MSDMSVISVADTMQTGPPVGMTDRALREVWKIFEDEKPESGIGLRISVKGGGCSGLSYEMDFAHQEEGDMVVDFEALKVYLDSQSSIYLRGTTIDFEGGLRGKGFVFKNPNAKRTCSCGDSFAM